MPSQYIGLPPGIYNIQSGGKNVVNPGANDNQLVVAAVTNKSNQRWLITGDGIIKSMEKDVSWAYSDFAQAGAPQKVTRQDNKKVQWIIQVIPTGTDNNSFMGSIMTSDASERYWGLTGNQVQLDATLTTRWKFIPA